MPVPNLTFDQLLAKFDDPERKRKIEFLLGKKGVDGMVFYENVQLDSSHCGESTAVIYGPKCTYTTVEEATAGHLGDLPSERQYPRGVYVKPKG